MKVLYVYKTSMPASYGGVESFIDTLCKAGTKLGVKNTVLTLHPKPQKQPIQMDGYSVHQAKQNLFLASTGFSVSAFSKFKRLSNDADIIHYHFPNPFADIDTGVGEFAITPTAPRDTVLGTGANSFNKL